MYHGTESHPISAGVKRPRRRRWLTLALVGLIAGCSQEAVVGGGTTPVAGFCQSQNCSVLGDPGSGNSSTSSPA